MKLCNSEIIKKVKDLDEQKYRILSEERNNCTSKYQKESDLIDLGYNFAVTRKNIEEINREIVKFKHALNVANATVNVPEFNITIGECIVYMAQLNSEKRVLEAMSQKSSKSRETTYGGVIEYTITNYDIEECKQKLLEINDIVRKLQISIDRGNLEHTTEF
jgi:hypothetical protein